MTREPKPYSILSKRPEFLTLRTAPRFHTASFVLQGVVNSEGEKGLKGGFTVTRKCGTAVERNRIKRRLRHALATALADPAFRRRFNGRFAVVARRKALYEPFGRLVADLRKGLEELALKRARIKAIPADNKAPGDEGRHQLKSENSDG